MKTDTCIIILTRNEVEGVRTILPKIPPRLLKLCLAVDYRSTDGTVACFKKYGIPVLRQTVPGRGEAFQLGARATRADNLVFFSPDGNEDPGDIPELIRLLKKGNDLVIASRFMKNARNEEDDHFLKWRAWANQAFTYLVYLLWGRRLTDSINGYRAIRKRSFERLHLDAQGFAIEFQMSIRAVKLGMRIAEIPTREGDRIGGQSTSYAIPTGIRFIGYLIRELVIGTGFTKSRQ